MADSFHIQAPDGSLVEFPASTPDEVVKSVMAKAYPPPAAAERPEMSYGDQMRHVGGAIDSVVRSLANGIPFMDRIAAAGGAATGIGGKFGDYSGNLEAQRAEDKKLADAAPGVDTPVGRVSLDSVGHLVGGALVPMGAAAKVGSLAADVPLGIKTIYGMGTGATIGGVQGLSGTKDLTNVPQAAKDTGLGAIVGAGVGGAIPGASKIIGAGYEKAANAFTSRVDGMSNAAGAHLVKAIETDGPAAVQARLRELGPDAMLADAGPGLLGTTQGAVGNSLEARSTMTNALTKRNEGTNARIQSDVDRALGPVQGEDPQLVTDRIRRFREEQDARAYPPALDNAPPVRIAPIMSELVDRISQTPAGSMENKALTNLQTMLTKKVREPLLDSEGYSQYDKLGNERFKEVPVSHDDANVLHKVKMEIDNVVEHDKPGLGLQPGALNNQQATLKQMRFAINNALETQVPGYAAANRASAALAKRAEAVQAGTQYLGSKTTTPSPQRFAFDFAGLEPGEQIAFAKGSRGNIDRVLGTKANDLQALRSELQGEGGWNQAKIATVHGMPAADELASSVNRNLKFRDTHSKVIENSQTDLRNAARKEMRPDPSTDTPFFNPNSTLTGMGVTAAKKGAQGAWNALTRSDPTRSYGEVARVLSAQGAQRDAHLASIIDAIGQRGSNSDAAAVAGKYGSIIAAIAGNTALHDGPMRKRQ
jgi:hypothetical protein